MRNITAIFLVLILMYSCKQSHNFEVAYQISEKDLIPEGITYSNVTNSFYLSSIYDKKIIQIDAISGEYKDFISPEKLGLRMLGLLVDDERNQLWACGNISLENKRLSAIFKLDLYNGDIIKMYECSDSNYKTFNDLVLDKLGNVYFTNESAQTIYRIDRESDSISIFFDDENIEYPNGITISPDNKYLYVASGSKGIKIIDISLKKIVNPHNSTFNSKGIDGLKYYKNSIIGIQNYVVNPSDRNISRYYLNEEGTDIISMEIIDKDNPYFDIPTTFVIANRSLFCLANSQMLNLTKNYEIKDEEALADIIILKYIL